MDCGCKYNDLANNSLKEYIISQAFYIKDGNSIRVLEGASGDRYKEENFNINNK